MKTDILRRALKKIPSRFELAVIAAERCKQLMEGATPKVEVDVEGTPPTKIALMELAEGKVTKSDDEGKSYILEVGPDSDEAQAQDGDISEPEEE